MTKSFEKRTDARAITDVALEIFDMASHELVGVGRLLNLSAMGACVETTCDLGGRGDLFVRMLLNRQLVAAPASVMWEKTAASTREYGLRFGPLSDEMKEVIETFIQENIAFYEETDLTLSPPPGAVRKS